MAVDIGGTFTDVVGLASDGTVVTRKLPSTTGDYAVAIVEGVAGVLEDLELEPSSVDEIIHGTTVATNAILEGKGARTALVTTAGFRDVLELQRIRIPKLYDLFYEKPRPLVPRHLRFEVKERLGPGGVVWEELDGESVERAVEAVATADVESVAVCLLHSYADAGHERAVAAALEAALPSAFVTCSSTVLNEMREYERTSTTVINAYVGPVVRRYLGSLTERLAALGIEAPLLVMQCSGGVMTLAAAAERPAYLVESGPAAGVKAAAELARRSGYAQVITLDMGGTTAKASAVEGGAVALTSEYEVGAGINVSSLLVKGGGYALKIPVVDVSEIGAGGGSIVHVDPGGRLQVGPESAGSVPGPACYGTGSDRATVTDAHVVLGYVAAHGLAGGSLPIDPELAWRAIQEQVAEPLGLDVLEAAHGVHTLACANMIRAVKAVSTYRGRDPREAILVAFGGNGPIVGADMAAQLDIGRVAIPPDAGVFSAFGLLHAAVAQQTVQTHLAHADAATAGSLDAAFASLGERSLELLRREGYDREEIDVVRAADLRYEEQGYELTIPVPTGQIDGAAVEALVSAFETEHLRTYGHRAADERVHVVTLRVTSEVNAGAARRWSAERLLNGAGASAHGEFPRRDVYFSARDGLVSTPVLTRSELGPAALPGPMIVQEYDTCCVVPSGWTALRDSHGNVVLEARA